jgi:hypothetical protein
VGKTFWRIIVTATLAVGLPLGLMTTTAASASAARPHVAINGGCLGNNGYYCHGLDPYGQGCPISSTKTSTPSQSAYVTVWNEYSFNCDANWAQGQLTPTARAVGDSFQLAASTTDRYGNKEFMCVPGPSNTGALTEYCYGYNIGGSGVAWTDMVDGHNVADAIGYVYNAAHRLIQTVVVPQ